MVARLLLALVLALSPVLANAGTLIITAAGFTNLGATPPAGWPANVTWPAGASPNGSKTFTINDADWQGVLTWMAANQQAQISAVTGSSVLPLTPTATQILLAWLQIWTKSTVAAVQQFNTAPAAPPAPISIQ